jgi:hypothetical protein
MKTHKSPNLDGEELAPHSQLDQHAHLDGARQSTALRAAAGRLRRAARTAPRRAVSRERFDMA